MKLPVRPIIGLFVMACVLNAVMLSARAERPVACEAFTKITTSSPEPRDDPHSRERLEAINAAITAEPHQVLFLGDSITERWTKEIWQENFGARGGLNAGIDGDRTEHLLWRLEHGNLDGTPPKVIVLLIGTNDLGHGRSPELAAEGIRSDLIYLREQLPGVHVLLLGLTPRSDRFRDKVIVVNQLIKTCNSGFVRYANIGNTLLDRQGHLIPTMSLDGVHFTAAGYQLLTQQLKPLIDALLAGQ
jgi:lysophospholipase L1-like esterase